MATPYNFSIPQSQVLDVGQWGENALAVKKRRSDEERLKKQDTMNDEIFGMKKEEHKNALADRLRNQQKEDEDRKWTEYERSAKQKMTKIQMDETYIGLSKNILANIDTSDPAKFQDSFMQALDKYNVLVQNRGLTPEEAEQATKNVALQFGDINTIKRVQTEQLGKPESAPGQVMSDVNRGFLTPEQGTGYLDAQNTKAMMGPEQPSTVREWEYFNALSPEDRERYLSMKRAQQNIDIGGSVVQPSMGTPGQIAGEFEKTLPPEKTPQAISEAETARKEAELGARLVMEPKIEEAVSAATNRAKMMADAAGTARSNQTALKVYEESMSYLSNSLGKTATGPVVGLIPAVTSSQQIADGAIAAMAPVLKQIFRTAGEGIFTDKDQELLLRMIPDRRSTPEAKTAQIAAVDSIVRAKLGAKGGASPSSPPQDGGGTVPLPPAAVSQLQPGKVTTFRNGQKWTMGTDGQPHQVQ